MNFTLPRLGVLEFYGASINDEKTLHLSRGISDFIVSVDPISFILETAPVYGTLHILIH